MKRLEPAIPLHDPRYVYIPAHATDISVRFRVERARLKAAAERQECERAAGVSHLTIIRERQQGAK